MKKLLKIAVLTFVVFSFSGCHQNSNNIEEVIPDAGAQLDLAYDEAYALLSSASRQAENSDYESDDYHTWNLRDKLEAAAWLGVQTGDATEVIKIAKENDIYDDLIDIVEKYNVENCLKSLDANANSARTISKSDFNTLKRGDIVYSRTLSSSGGSSETSSSAGSSVLGILTKGYFKHAGIIDNVYEEDKCVLSASSTAYAAKKKGKGTLGVVGYETKSRWTSSDYHIAATRVKNYDAKKAESALNYGKEYIGTDYGFSGRDSDSNFYCSKVVYRCWKSQGYDLEYHTKKYAKGLFVTPQDLYDDDDTYYLFGDKPE